MKWVALPLAGALVAGVALAGDPGPAPGASARAEASAKVAAGAAAGAKVSAAGFLMSLRLPALAHETRGKGVPNDEVKLALASLREAKVAPEEAIETFKATVAAVDEKGPVEKFGEFVQSKLKEGLRGPKLAKAIREEHDKRGIGKGKKLTKDDEQPGKHLGQDPAAKAEHMDGKGKPEDKADKGPGSADHPGKGAEKADDKGSKGAEKADDKGSKGAEKAVNPAPGPEGKPGGPQGGPPGGKQGAPGEAKAGHGKEK